MYKYLEVYCWHKFRKVYIRKVYLETCFGDIQDTIVIWVLLLKNLECSRRSWTTHTRIKWKMKRTVLNPNLILTSWKLSQQLWALQNSDFYIQNRIPQKGKGCVCWRECSAHIENHFGEVEFDIWWSFSQHSPGMRVGSTVKPVRMWGIKNSNCHHMSFPLHLIVVPQSQFVSHVWELQFVLDTSYPGCNLKRDNYFFT